MITAVCQVCKNPKQIYPYRAESFKVCSYECLGIFYGGSLVERICKQCGKSEMLSPWRASHQFCSLKCYADFRRLPGTNESRRDPEAKRVKNRRHKARVAFKKHGIDSHVGDLTTQQWKEILVLFDGFCAYCGKRPKAVTMDHVIPVSKGGRHEALNVVPACSHCNQTKKDKIVEPRFDPRRSNKQLACNQSLH